MDESKLQDIADWSRSVVRPSRPNPATDSGPPYQQYVRYRSLNLPPPLEESRLLRTMGDETQDKIDREARLYERKMARREAKALKTRSPPHLPSIHTVPPPLRRRCSPVIRRAEEPELTEPRSKKRKSRLEEWELFQPDNARNGKRLTIPQGIRGKKGIFDRSITSEVPGTQVSMCRHQPEPTEEGDWRDAWRAPRRTRKTSQPEPLARHDNESEIEPSRSAAGERLQTGMDRSLLVIMSSPPHQPRPQLVRKPYYSPSWPTWRANPTTSSTGPRSAPRCLGIRKLGVRDAANLDGRRDVPYLFVAPTQDPRFPAMPTSFIHPYVTPQTPGPVSGDRPGQYTSGLARISEPWKFSVKPLEDHQKFDRPPSTAFIPPPIYVSQSSRRTSLLTSEGALSRAPRLLHHQVVPGTPSGWGSAHDARKSLEPDLQERRARYPSGELQVPVLIYPAPSSNSIPAVTLPERPDHQALYDTTAAFHFGRPPAMAFVVADNASLSPYASSRRQTLPTYSQTRASQQNVHWTPTRERNEALALVHAAANLNEEPARLSGVEDVLVQLAQHLPSSSHRSGPSARSRSEPPIPFGISALAPATLSQDDQELPPSQHRNSPKLEPGWIAYGPQTPQQQIPFGVRGRCGAYATPAEPATGVSSAREVHVDDADFNAVSNQVLKTAYPNSASRRSTSTFARSRRTDPTHFCSSSTPDPLLLRSDQIAEQELWHYGTTKQDWGKLWSDARNDL